MNNKKTIGSVVLGIFLVCLIGVYIFKSITMNDIYDEPNFTGMVTEVYGNSIMVSVNEGEDEFKSSDIISVSLDVKLKDSMTTFNVGQNVKIFYDGVILETYPARIRTVYAILLVNE